MPFISAIVAGIGAIGSAIGGAVAAVSAFTVGGFAIGQTLVSLGLSLGLSALSSLLTPKPKTSSGGAKLELDIGGEVSRQGVFGKAAVRGHMAFFHTSGNENSRIDLVYILSEGRCESLNAVWIEGEKKTLVAQTATQTGVRRFQIDGYGSKAEVRFFDGRIGQLADAALVANTGGRIGNADRFAGLTYVSVTLTYDDTLFGNGIPEFLWELSGLRCYDPRFDSTAGGSGAYRIDDPSTWQFTENPALIALAWLIGVRAETTIVAGVGIQPVDILMSSVIAAANICDEPVTLAAGGTEPRYRAAAVLTAQDSDHRTVLRPILDAMAGYLIEKTGRFGFLAGAAQSSVYTLTDADLVLGQEIRWQASRSRTERVNEVYGQFTDPASGWSSNSYAPISSSSGLAEDGEPLRVSFDLETVTSATQAQRVARIRLRESRRQARATITVGMHLTTLDPGDWLTWQSDKFATTRTYRIGSRQINADDTVTLTLQEIDATVFDWTSADEEAIVVGTRNGRPALQTNIANFAAIVQRVSNVLGQTRAQVLLTWTPTADPTIDAVIIEYRKAGSSEATRLRDDSPGDGRFVIDGLPENEVYEFRATIATTPFRVTTTTAWVQVRTDDGLLAAPGSVSGFAINVLSDVATLTWLENPESNIDHYVIRYTPTLVGATWGAASVLAANVKTLSFATPALAGSYLIKAVTQQGRESTNATLIVSGITSADLNAVVDLTQHPSFAGGKTNVTVNQLGLQLLGSPLDGWPTLDEILSLDYGYTGVALTGTYAFDTVFDLGAVYPCRIIPTVTAFGLNLLNTVDSWTTLDLVDNLDGDNPGVWTATIESRFTNDNPGASPTWTAWAPLVVSDRTFRAVESRLVLTTTDARITPTVTALSIRVDMPDRIISGKDLACGVGGLRVDFTPNYRALTGLSIAAQNMATGDYAVISPKDQTGFNIIFRNSAGTAVARTFDYVAAGYGEVR